MEISSSRVPYRAFLVTSVAGAALLLGAAGHASAQSVAQAPAAAPNEVAVVVVTAQRRSENIQNVPVSVQAISPKQIQALGIKETQDIAELTPNVSIYTTGGEGSEPVITIRGIGLNDFDTNNAGPNGVYVDDVYISAPTAQGFALFDLSQIQVLKGPQGTLYGRNTSGGAVLFSSNRPTDYYTGDFGLEYGNFNTLALNGAVGGPIAPNLDGRVAFVYDHSDGFMHNDLNDTPASPTNNEALRLQLLYKPTDKLTVLFSSAVGYNHSLPTEYGRYGTFVPGTQGSANPVMCSVAQTFAGGCRDMFGYGTPKGFYNGSYSRTQWQSTLNLMETLRVDADVGPVKLTSITSFVHNDRFLPENTDAGPDNLLAVDYKVKSDTYTQEFRASRSEKQYNWVVGLYYLHEILQQNQPLYLFGNGDEFGGFGVPPGPGAFDGIAQRSYDNSKQYTDSLAAFGQGDYTLGKFTLTLGGRVTYERKAFQYYGSTQYQSGGTGNYGPLQDIITANEAQYNTNFTGRIALNYHFTNQIMTYASVATGFKSGDFNGSFLSNVPAQALFELQPVKPERVTAYEVGAKMSFFDRRVTFDSAFFYNDYRDEQVFAQVPQLLASPTGPIQSITNIITNARQAHTEGVEVEVVAVPIHGLTITVQPAYLDTKLDNAGLPFFDGAVSLNGNQLANSPHFSLAATAEYKYPIGDDDIDFAWNSSYRSHQFLDSTNDPYLQQNGYWLHNLNITYQSHEHWEAGVYVRNLTGTKYDTLKSDLSQPFGFIQTTLGLPRTFGARITYHF